MGDHACFAFPRDCSSDRHCLLDDLPLCPSLASGLLCAIRQQDWNPVFNRVPALALAAAYLVAFRDQAAVAHRTGQHGQYVWGKSLVLHANSVRILYHEQR
jgi:hypothetical protein